MLTRPTNARRRALTLLELMLASAACTFVALAVAMMMSAISYGTDSRRDMHSLVAVGKTTTARLDAAIRGSRQVLSVGSASMVLWTADDNGDGQPSLLELRRLDLSASDGELRSYRVSGGVEDVSYGLDEDFGAVTAGLVDGGEMTAELWATQITGWEIALDAPAPADARLVAYRLAMRIGDMNETTLGVAAMRNAR